MWEPNKRDATACHWCERPFKLGQVRFLVMDEAGWEWERVSICGLCWKDAALSGNLPDEIDRHGEQIKRQCAGCGEPMSVLSHYRGWRIACCSIRCEQRHRRQLNKRSRRCDVCKKGFTPSRKDARHCSNACRQWAYRQRTRCYTPDVAAQRAQAPAPREPRCP